MTSSAAAPPATLTRSASSGGVAPQAHMGSPIFDEQIFRDSIIPLVPKIPDHLNDDEKNVRQDPEPRNAPLLTWILGFLCAILVLAIICLGVGLGIKWNQAEDRADTLQLAGSNSNFNYRSFFGIPQYLPVVQEKDLIRQNELDLETGFQKPMILINNQSPGPLIEANSGDLIRVIVNNQMANWSTTVHWHGIDQKGSNWMDGVAGVTQCGIPPGKSFTYEFSTDGQRGTYWYHSHLSTQYTDGLFGPIVIHDTDERVQSVDDEKVIFIGDLYHTYSSILTTSYLNATSKWANGSGVEPLPDNLLMNGRNTYNCSVQSSTFPSHMNATTCSGGSLYSTNVQSNKTYRLRLINHSSFLSYWFSIDNHTIDIIEIDGVEIEPISFRGVYVNIGQRYSVLVRTNQAVGNYNIRATVPKSCFQPFIPYTSNSLDSAGRQVRGVLSYDGTDPKAPTIGAAGETTNPYFADQNSYGNGKEGCNDMPFDMPKPVRVEPSYTAGQNNTHYIEFEFMQSQNVNRIFVNKTSWAPLENNATIWKANELSTEPSVFGGYNNFENSINQQVLTSPDNSSAVELVINSIDAMEHPWHLHGHDFQIVGWGQGLFGTGNTQWSWENPMRRDTVTIPANWHVVLRWKNDSPGIWALHCHVAWHMEGGMFVQFAERVPDLRQMLADESNAGLLESSRNFCGQDNDQSFVTNAEYEPHSKREIESASS